MTGQQSPGRNTRKVATWCGQGQVIGPARTTQTGADAPPFLYGAPAPTHAPGAPPLLHKAECA
jgi:hypothetical protein